MSLDNIFCENLVNKEFGFGYTILLEKIPTKSLIYTCYEDNLFNIDELWIKIKELLNTTKSIRYNSENCVRVSYKNNSNLINDDHIKKLVEHIHYYFNNNQSVWLSSELKYIGITIDEFNLLCEYLNIDFFSVEDDVTENENYNDDYDDDYNNDNDNDFDLYNYNNIDNRDIDYEIDYIYKNDYSDNYNKYE
jgi:hypothetical protein